MAVKRRISNRKPRRTLKAMPEELEQYRKHRAYLDWQEMHSTLFKETWSLVLSEYIVRNEQVPETVEGRMLLAVTAAELADDAAEAFLQKQRSKRLEMLGKESEE